MSRLESPLRLRIDSAALTANWRALARLSGSAACGAAVKADGYGLGAREVVPRLAEGGCRDFFVATWGEAAALADTGVSLSVLHGVREADMAVARPANARPVLNSPEQVRRWRDAGGGACDVMVDTGMNRLGLSVADATSGLLDGLAIETLMSHLACAEQDVPMNARQRAAFAALAGRTGAKRMSLSNSGGVLLGTDYAFDLTRPGLALYGGIPNDKAQGVIAPVVAVEAQVLQRRSVGAGESVGYNATFTAAQDMSVAILNIGYADGYLRGFSGRGEAIVDGTATPVLGRVSMDLLAISAEGLDIGEGDWVRIAYDLPRAAAQSGLSQYELLVLLGARFDRVWT